MRVLKHSSRGDALRLVCYLIVTLPAWSGRNAMLLAFQAYGGQPPWGLEQPVRIRGGIHRGDKFEKQIGRGLYLRLVPDDEGWQIEVGDQHDDFTGCVNPPFHGITPMQIEGWHFRTDDNTAARPSSDFLSPGVGEKRWFDFVLSADDNKKECDNLSAALYINDEKNPEHVRALSDMGQYTSGRGWLAITAITLGNLVPGQQAWIESLQFEAELSFTGALELWKLPSRYVILKGYTGWVRVHYNEKGAAPSPKKDGYQVLQIPSSGVLHTSAELRTDSRDAQYIFSDGAVASASGTHRQIWAWTTVFAGDCGGTYHLFFVGTKQQYASAPNTVSYGSGNCTCTIQKDKDGAAPEIPCESAER